MEAYNKAFLFFFGSGSGGHGANWRKMPMEAHNQAFQVHARSTLPPNKLGVREGERGRERGTERERGREGERERERAHARALARERVY
jgi:hypothetical protein